MPKTGSKKSSAKGGGFRTANIRENRLKPQQNFTLDLHGRHVDAAVREVTLFLENIRRSHGSLRLQAVNSCASSLMHSNASDGGRIICARIITGTGSHGSHGPVLRNAIHKLLTKRGMSFVLDSGGGAFRVDALSGWDLYGPGPDTDSKVVLLNQETFSRIASAKTSAKKSYDIKHKHASSTRRVESPRSFPSLQDGRRSADSKNGMHDLPQDPQIATRHELVSRDTSLSSSQSSLEEDTIRAAMRLSALECNQKMLSEKELHDETKRALRKSRQEHDTHKRMLIRESVELRRALSMAAIGSDGHCNGCLTDDHQTAICKQQSSLNGTKQQPIPRRKSLFDIDAPRADEDSILVNSDEDLFKIASQRSVADEQSRQESMEKNEKHYEEALRLALEESSQLSQSKWNEAKKNTEDENDLLEKALAASMMEQEVEDYDDALERILKLSTEEKDAGDDDLKRAIELSMNEIYH